MAKSSSAQQSSQLKKLLLLGGGLVVIVFVAFPSGSGPTAPAAGGNKANLSSGPGKGSTKKVDPFDTKEDHDAKFERIGATIKNGFVPGVGKGDGALTNSDIPSSWADGEGTWTYTGNMVVDGTPNALLENSTSGDGVFLRPGQHWKNLRLLAVKEDSIELEGPGGLRKTVFFNEKTTSGSGTTPLQTLPPASIQGNLPNGANPQNFGNGGGGGGRRNRGQQADQGNAEAMTGPIGENLTSSVDGIDQNNSNPTGNNRRIGRNQ